MQWTSYPSSRPGARVERGLRDLQPFHPRESLYPRARHGVSESYCLLKRIVRQKWFWALLLFVFAFIESYFVRALLSALLFFTVFYVILVALAALFVVIDHGLSCGLAWLWPHLRSAYSASRACASSYAGALKLAEGRVIHRNKNPARN